MSDKDGKVSRKSCPSIPVGNEQEVEKQRRKTSLNKSVEVRKISVEFESKLAMVDTSSSDIMVRAYSLDQLIESLISKFNKC